MDLGRETIDIPLHFCYKQNMNKRVSRLCKFGDKGNDDFVAGSMNSRIALVWPLTEEVASISRNHNVKRRLQRNVAVVNHRAS